MKPLLTKRIQPASEDAPKEGISEKLKGILKSLDESTDRMQAAIVSQKVVDIWAVLAEQERIAAEFQQYSCLWGHLIAGSRGNPEIEKSFREINSSFETIRKKNKCNMALIKNFLATINRAFAKAGTQNAQKTSVYGRHGKMQYKPRSIVFNQEG